MAFTKVLDLDADVTVSIGGKNKKTGKPNPTRVEGYYIGKKEIADTKKKSGVSYIYFLQTPKGNVGVWGKTDMDNKMKSVAPGTMCYIAFLKMVPTPNGDMYKYEVGVDQYNTIEVPGGQAADESLTTEDGEYEASGGEVLGEDDAVDTDDSALAAQAEAAQRQAKVQALLNKNKSK